MNVDRSFLTDEEYEQYKFKVVSQKNYQKTETTKIELESNYYNAKIYYYSNCEVKDCDDNVLLMIFTKPKDIDYLNLVVSKDLIYYKLSELPFVSVRTTDKLIKSLKIAEKSSYALVLCLNDIFEKLNFEV